MNQQQLGQTLQQLRQKHKLSQEELSERIKVSRQAISKWERGEATPDIYNLKALSDLYQITIDDIVSNEVNHSTVTTVERVELEPIESNIIEPTSTQIVHTKKRKTVLFPIITFFALILSIILNFYGISYGGEGFLALVILILIPVVIYFSFSFSKEHYTYSSTNLSLKILSLTLTSIALLFDIFVAMGLGGGLLSLLSVILLILPTIVTVKHLKYVYVKKQILIAISIATLLIELLITLLLFSTSVTVYFGFIVFVFAMAFPATIIIKELTQNENNTAKLVLNIVAVSLLGIKLILLFALMFGEQIAGWLFLSVWIITTLVCLSNHILSLVLEHNKKNELN